MKNLDRRRNLSLVGLYILFLIASCSIRQLKYFPMAKIILAVTIVVIIISWRFLYKKKIIGISFFSTAQQKNIEKSERLFLYSIGTTIMPVLKLRNITILDVILSIALFAIMFLFYRLDIWYLDQKKSRVS